MTSRPMKAPAAHARGWDNPRTIATKIIRLEVGVLHGHLVEKSGESALDHVGFPEGERQQNRFFEPLVDHPVFTVFLRDP